MRGDKHLLVTLDMVYFECGKLLSDIKFFNDHLGQAGYNIPVENGLAQGDSVTEGLIPIFETAENGILKKCTYEYKNPEQKIADAVLPIIEIGKVHWLEAEAEAKIEPVGASLNTPQQ